MTNFLKETIEAIEESGHRVKDVMFVGSSDGKYRLKFPEFAKIADFDYNPGFGSQEIAKDLIIYLKNKTYIARGEYDGSEWWEYNVPKVFKPSDRSKPYKNVWVGQVEKVGLETVEELNRESVEESD